MSVLMPCQPFNHGVVQEDLSGLWKQEEDRTWHIVPTRGDDGFDQLTASWNSSKLSTLGEHPVLNRRAYSPAPNPPCGLESRQAAPAALVFHLLAITEEIGLTFADDFVL